MNSGHRQTCRWHDPEASAWMADTVAKIPKRRATKFPPNDKTSGNRRSM